MTTVPDIAPSYNQSELAVRDYPVGLTGYMTVRYLEPLSLAFTFVAPLFAMRSFSDEFRDQTIALWQSSPISTVSLVLGKFLGVMLVLSMLVLLAVGLLLVLRWFVPLDIPVLLSATLGLFLCTAACAACGLFFSSLTAHSLVAISASLALLLLSWLLASADFGIDALQGLRQLAIPTHLHGFFQGYLRSNDVLFFVLMCMLFLGLSIIRLDSLRQSGY